MQKRMICRISLSRRMYKNELTEREYKPFQNAFGTYRFVSIFLCFILFFCFISLLSIESTHTHGI